MVCIVEWWSIYVVVGAACITVKIMRNVLHQWRMVVGVNYGYSMVNWWCMLISLEVTRQRQIINQQLMVNHPVWKNLSPIIHQLPTTCTSRDAPFFIMVNCYGVHQGHCQRQNSLGAPWPRRRATDWSPWRLIWYHGDQPFNIQSTMEYYAYICIYTLFTHIYIYIYDGIIDTSLSSPNSRILGSSHNHSNWWTIIPSGKQLIYKPGEAYRWNGT